MAFHSMAAINGGDTNWILTTYDTWDDPPSNHRAKTEKTEVRTAPLSAKAGGFLGTVVAWRIRDPSVDGRNPAPVDI